MKNKEKLLMPEHIEKLHDVYWGVFLYGLANNDPLVFECLEKAHCELGLENSYVLFKLPKLFDAVWIFASRKGLELPENTSFKDDFYAFCKPLKFPFLRLPEDISGILIELTSNVGSKMSNEYRATITNSGVTQTLGA